MYFCLYLATNQALAFKGGLDKNYGFLRFAMVVSVKPIVDSVRL